MSRIKNLFKNDYYTLAIRKRQGGLLFENNLSTFSTLKLKKNQWYADPFLFTYKGEDYVFCEVFECKKNKGAIGVSKIVNDKIMAPEIVLDLPFHLSYPCVFEFNGQIYLIPETTKRDNIQLFKSVHFPDKWEFMKTLKTGGKFADSTIFESSGSLYLLTFLQYQNNGNLCKLHIDSIKDLNKGKLEPINVNESEFSPYVRGAGRLFVHNNHLLRPSQICTPHYGYGLRFNNVNFSNDFYEEQELFNLFPNSIKTDRYKRIKGTHTYAINDRYEVIDIKFNHASLRVAFSRLMKHFSRKNKQCK